MSLHQLAHFLLKLCTASSHSSNEFPRSHNSVQLFNVYIFYTVFLTTFSFAQVVSFKGIVVDAVTQSPISNATIVLRETREEKKSNTDGFFQFSIQQNKSYTITAQHFAYLNLEQNIIRVWTSSDTIIIFLHSKIFQSDGVVIHSTRLFTETESTPFPVNVQNSNELIRKNNLTISDALDHSPGLSLVRDGAWETAISIRGMNRSNIVMLIDNSRIETANDIAGALSLFNTHDLEQIETIRSPGAAVHGTGALGGIVHLISKCPEFSDEFQVTSQLSSDFSSVNNYRSQHLAIESSSERLTSRVSGGFRNAENTTTPSGTIPNSQFTDFSLTGFVGIKTFDDQVMNFSYQRSQAENAGISGGSPISTTAKATYKLAQRELFGIEYLIPNVTENISSLAIRLSQQTITRNVEIIQTPTLTLTPHAIHATTSGQIESNIALSKNDLLVIGTDVWQRRLVSKREKINTTNNTITGERPIPESQFFSAGLYGQNEWNIIPNKLVLLFGARYDWININNNETRNPEYIISNGIFNSSPANQIILWNSGSETNESWSGNGGVQYSLTDNIGYSILVSTAFRSPSLEERFQYLTLGDGVHVGNPNLIPERSVGLNAGITVRTPETNIRTDFFLNTLTNLVTDVPGTFEGNSAFIKQNISEARFYGYELSGEQLFTSWIAMNFSLSYVRGEDTYNHSNLPQISPLHGVIEFSARTLDIGSVSLSMSSSASQKYVGIGEKQTSGYTIFDFTAATIPLSFNYFSIVTRCGIQNIFNKAYRNHLSTIRGNVTSEPGRNFFASLSIDM